MIDLEQFQKLNAAQILTQLADPKSLDRRLSHEEKWAINQLINQRLVRLDNDLETIFSQVVQEFAEAESLMITRVKNYQKKLEVILSKEIITDNIMNLLEVDMQEKIISFREKTSRKTDASLDLKKTYPVDLTVYSHRKNDYREPYLIIKKNSKSPGRIASKITRKIYEGSIKRNALGMGQTYDINDGMIMDFKGMQFVTLHDYQKDAQFLNLEKDPITTLKYYITSARNIDIVRLTNHYEGPGEYNAVHLKVRFLPTIDNSPKQEYEVPPDIIDIQIIDINNFLKKEIGYLNQISYAQSQESLMDRRFLEEIKLLGKHARMEALNPPKKHREYIEKCKARLLEVLTYHLQ